MGAGYNKHLRQLLVRKKNAHLHKYNSGTCTPHRIFQVRRGNKERCFDSYFQRIYKTKVVREAQRCYCLVILPNLLLMGLLVNRRAGCLVWSAHSSFGSIRLQREASMENSGRGFRHPLSLPRSTILVLYYYYCWTFVLLWLVITCALISSNSGRDRVQKPSKHT